MSQDCLVKTTDNPALQSPAIESRGLASAGTTRVVTAASTSSGSLDTPLWVDSTREWSASLTGVLSVLRRTTVDMSGVIDTEHPESRFASPEGVGLIDDKRDTAAWPAVTSSSDPEKSDSLSPPSAPPRDAAEVLPALAGC